MLTAAEYVTTVDASFPDVMSEGLLTAAQPGILASDAAKNRFLRRLFIAAAHATGTIVIASGAAGLLGPAVIDGSFGSDTASRTPNIRPFSEPLSASVSSWQQGPDESEHLSWEEAAAYVEAEVVRLERMRSDLAAREGLFYGQDDYIEA